MKRSYQIILIIVFFLTSHAYCQTVVQGSFEQDSAAIGESIIYTLSVRYPSHQNILFPDSTYNFAPFEFSKKVFFPTTTSNGISLDSAIYYLTTFEVDSIQLLALPIYTVNRSDCTATTALADTIYLKEFVTAMPSDTVRTEDLPLKVDLIYNPVDYLFNYPIIGIVFAGLIILLIVVWFLFGKKIRKYLIRKKLLRNYKTFVSNFNPLVDKVSSHFSPELTESALASWKKYMELLESHPYTKLTTREAMGFFKDQKLTETLSKIDAAVYGHNTAVEEPLKTLGQYAHEKFNAKLDAINNG